MSNHYTELIHRNRPLRFWEIFYWTANPPSNLARNLGPEKHDRDHEKVKLFGL